MKYRTFIVLILLISIWTFVSVKWIGFKKPTTVKVNTTPEEFVSPTPTSQDEPTSTKSAEIPVSTSSSFIIAVPSISVLRY